MTRHTYDEVGGEARVRAAVVRADNAGDHSLARPTTDPAMQRAVAEVRAYEHGDFTVTLGPCDCRTGR